jgi:hypothetical protein
MLASNNSAIDTTTRVLTIAECKLMSKESLLEIVASNAHTLSRMQAIAVLYGMPDDTSAADQYRTLLNFVVEEGGGSKYMRVQRAIEKGVESACASQEEDESADCNTPPVKAAPDAPPDQKYIFTMAKMDRQPQF